MSADAVTTVVDFLAPFVPYLLRATEEATEEAARRFGSEAWTRAKQLWRRVKGDQHQAPADWQAAVAAAMADPGTARELIRLTQQVRNDTHVDAGRIDNLVIGTQFNDRFT